MTKEQLALLLATARVLRAHLKGHTSDTWTDVGGDLMALEEAFKPYNPSTKHGGDFAEKDRT